MKIAQIKTHLISVPVEEKSAWTSSLGRAVKRDALIVEMETDNGLVGIGECYHGSSPLVLEKLVQTVLTPVLLGKDPLNLELNKALMYRRCKLLGNFGMATMAISGLEIALFDIIGKQWGAPICQILGNFREWAPVYVGGLCLGWKDRDALCAEAQKYVSQGFKAMKLRVGRSFGQDVDCVGAVREAVGDDIRLMADANQGYADSLALKIIKEYEKYDLFWLEEPVHYEKLETMRNLKEQSFVNVAAGENSFSLEDFRRVFASGAVDIIQPDCCKIGGISETKKVAILAEAYKIDVAPHIIGTSIALAAALQAIGAMPNGILVEWDASENNLFRDGIIRQPYELKDGQIRIPGRPGLGIEVDYDFLREYPYVDGPCYV